MKTTLLCLLNTILMATGQMLFKYGSSGKSITGIIDIIKLLFSPVVLLALCLYGGTTILWLYILSKTPMSFAYPIQALAFPIVLIASMFIFHEQIPPMRWIGVFVIIFGVFVATRA